MPSGTHDSSAERHRGGIIALDRSSEYRLFARGRLFEGADSAILIDAKNELAPGAPSFFTALILGPNRPKFRITASEPMSTSEDFSASADDESSSRSQAREAAKNKVIAAGNAQAVFNRLGEIEADRPANLQRWIWELLQNARDAAGLSGQVSVEVTFDGANLMFQHDGPPFRDEEIAHLIFHGSTKHDEHSGIGRFGTGFISTHLLSRLVRIRGPLDDHTVFDFVLDRTGDDPRMLESSMERSWDSMNTSLRKADDTSSDRLTQYSYPIDAETVPVVGKGLDELTRMAPLILAFNPQFVSLSVEVADIRTTFRVRERETLATDLAVLHIVDTAEQHVAEVVLAHHDDVCVAVVLKKDLETDNVLPAIDMSRMYVAFPLSATAHYPLPAAINSEQFHPRTERDGIYLDSDDSPKNVGNRKRFERACRLFGPLIHHVAQHHVYALTKLLVLTEPAELLSVNSEWLTKTIRTKVIPDIVNRPILLSRERSLISPKAAIIPYTADGDRRNLWRAYSSLTNLGPRLPLEEDIDAWNVIIASWSAYTGTSPEQCNETWTLEDLVAHVAECETLSVLTKRVDGDVWQWLSSVLDLLRAHDAFELAENYSVLPDQNGDLKKAGELHIDRDIPDDLKDLAEEVGLKGRAALLATELAHSYCAGELDDQTQDDFIHLLLEELSVGDEELAEAMRLPLIRLFCFVASNQLESWLERIPIVNAGSTVRIAKINLAASQREKYLVPVLRWSEAAKPFGELFPSNFVLNEGYADQLPNEADWEWLVERGAVASSPLTKDAVHVEDFVEMMRKGTDREEARSKEKVERSHLMYLTGDESVLERVRGSRRLGVLLVRFLVEFVVPNDPDAFNQKTIECEDDEERKCYGAAWIAQLLSRAWVKSGKRPSHLTAESVAVLLTDESPLVKRLLDDSNASLLESCDISPADLALRSVGKSESDRMSLMRSLSVIADAVGPDPALVARFATTIQTDATLLEYIQQRGTFIDRVQKNQQFGFTVEAEFKAAFNPTMGVRITRTGHGHDFLLSPIPGEEDDAGCVTISDGDHDVYVELKATRGSDAVHMSVRQVEAATSHPERYWLCVVVVEEEEISSEVIRAKARFVCDIGDQLKGAWAQYRALVDATPNDAANDSEAALEVSGQEVKFRIGNKLWTYGIGFEEAITKLKSTLDS